MITRLYRIFLLDKRLMLRRCVIWTTSRHWRCYDIWDFVTDCLYYYPQNLWSWSPLWFIWYNCHLYHHIDDSLVSLQRLSSSSLLSLRLYDFLHYFYITTMVLVSWYSLFYNYIFLEHILFIVISITVKNKLKMKKWDKVLKNGPSKISRRQSLKNLKAVLLKFYLAHSWILCPKCYLRTSQ